MPPEIRPFIPVRRRDGMTDIAAKGLTSRIIWRALAAAIQGGNRRGKSLVKRMPIILIQIGDGIEKSTFIHRMERIVHCLEPEFPSGLAETFLAYARLREMGLTYLTV